VPRVRGEAAWDEGTEIAAAIDEILSDTDPMWEAQRDPAVALELVHAGGLTDDERDQLRARAEEFIHDDQWTTHCEDVGAIVTGPKGAGDRMRQERGERARHWQRVLEALDFPSGR
jgi:hypothetical protein